MPMKAAKNIPMARRECPHFFWGGAVHFGQNWGGVVELHSEWGGDNIVSLGLGG